MLKIYYKCANRVEKNILKVYNKFARIVKKSAETNKEGERKMIKRIKNLKILGTVERERERELHLEK